MKPGTTKVALEFKLLGADKVVPVAAGAKVRFERNPRNPGQFVIWAGEAFHRKGAKYVTINAIDLSNVVSI